MRVPPPIAQKTRDSPTIVSMSISNRRGRIQISPCQIRRALRERYVQLTQIRAFSDTPPPVLLELTHSARLLSCLFFRRCLLSTGRRERSIVRFGPNLGKSRGPQFETRPNIQAWHHVENVDDLRELDRLNGCEYRKEGAKVPAKPSSSSFLYPAVSWAIRAWYGRLPSQGLRECAKTLVPSCVSAMCLHDRPRGRHLGAYSHVCGRCSDCVWR
jgi:hypothetical protein